MLSKKNTLKRIALFAPNLAGGGAERIISILAGYLVEQSFQVDLLLAKAAGPYLKNIPPAVNIIDLNCEKVLFSLPKLVSYLRSEQPDVLFSSQMHSSTIALWSAKIAGVDTRVIIRQPTMLMPSYKRKSLISNLKQKVFLKAVLRASKVIVSGSEMAKEFQALSAVEKNKIEVIHNPVPIHVIQERSDDPIDHPWFKLGEPPVILAVGRLAEVKDFRTLIKAFAVVQKQIPAHLIILGEGVLRLELEQLVIRLGISHRVQMPGFTANPYQYMKHAKVFVSSSLWEGFPNGMVEAMACGMSIVATDCEGGTSEVLEHGKWGYLVPVSNEEMMAKSIVKSLTDTESPDVLDRVACFSVDTIAAKYTKLFEIDRFSE